MDHNTKSIGELINAYFNKRGLTERIEEVDLNENWEKLVGPMIAKHTQSVGLKDKVLTLKLRSAALRHTLSFSKSELIDKVNTAAGKEIVEEVILK